METSPSQPEREFQAFKDETLFKNNPLYEVKPQQMNDLLHKNIGVLTFKSRKKSQINHGSGVLIAQDLVLTSAHNLYNPQTGELFYSFKFYPGPCGVLDRYLEIDDFYLPGKYALSPSTIYDYALLKLKSKVEWKDFIKLSGNLSKIKNQANLSIFGYPGKYLELGSKEGDKYKAYQYGLQQKGKIVEVKKEKGELIHQISTEKGQSGAPIVLENEDHELQIVGIHKGGVKTEKYGDANSGRLITSSLINIIKLEAQRMRSELPNFDSIETKNIQLQEQERNRFQEDVNLQTNEKSDLKKQVKEKPKINMKKFRGQMKKANKLASEGKSEEAINLAKNIIPQFLQYSYVYHNIGYLINQKCQSKLFYFNQNKKNASQQQKKKFEIQIDKERKEAIQNLEKAIQLDPKNADHIHFLGIIYQQMEQEIEAMDYFRKSVQVDPNYFLGYQSIGLSILKQPLRFTEGIKYLLKSFEMNPVNLKEFDLLLEDILTIGKGVEKDCAIVMEKLSHKYPEDKIIYKWKSKLQKYLK